MRTAKTIRLMLALLACLAFGASLFSNSVKGDGGENSARDTAAARSLKLKRKRRRQGRTTSSELMAEHLRGARLVKAFNTIYYLHLANQGDAGKRLAERRAIFIAGDDAEAKEAVARLVEEIGFTAVDTGLLREGGKRQQPDTTVYNRELTAKEAEAILESEA